MVSACRTHRRSVSPVQPIFEAIETIADTTDVVTGINGVTILSGGCDIFKPRCEGRLVLPFYILEGGFQMGGRFLGGGGETMSDGGNQGRKTAAEIDVD